MREVWCVCRGGETQIRSDNLKWPCQGLSSGVAKHVSVYVSFPPLGSSSVSLILQAVASLYALHCRLFVCGRGGSFFLYNRVYLCKCGTQMNVMELRVFLSVCAEAFNPDEDDEDSEPRVVHPKTDEQRCRLQEACRDILLFKTLDQVNCVATLRKCSCWWHWRMVKLKIMHLHRRCASIFMLPYAHSF